MKINKKYKIQPRTLIIIFIFCCIIGFFLLKLSPIFSQNQEKSDVDFEENSENSNDSLQENEENLNQEITDENDENLQDQSIEDEKTEKVSAVILENTEKSPIIETSNCTTSLGELMLINPNFTVDTNFISTRKSQLINITTKYGIREGNQWNGAPLLDAVAAVHLNDMLNDYKNYNPGHEITTRSCFRSVGTNCGRLCYATGTSDHHTGYTCDLIDDSYGDRLNTDFYSSHPEWQWLHENSYKYGFIDRFIPEWAGGSMSEPVNVNADGTTGLYESWHYRYVGINAATEIATGKYNNGKYDSLEHYLKSAGYVLDLLDKTSCN